MGTRTTILVALLAIAGLAAPALAEGSVAIDEASYDGAGNAAVTGSVALEPEGPQSVGGTNERPGADAVAEATGIDLVDASIERLADASGLRFIWEVNELPSQAPAEGIRYTWELSIEDTTYQLLAKRTDRLSDDDTRSPADEKGASDHADVFQLRGCEDATDAAAGCYHLAWLTGAFDPAGRRVYIDWAYDTKDALDRPVAAGFEPGAVVTESEGAGSSIAAGLHALASRTDETGIIGWGPYYTTPRIDLVAGSPEDAPETLAFDVPATLTGTTFAAHVAGLSPDKPAVWVRACDGVTCVYASKKVVL